MKKVMVFLTVVGLASVVIGARDIKKQQKSCKSTAEYNKEIAQEQEKCDRVKDDPYEDMICERTEIKKRRVAKEMEECEESKVDSEE